MASTREVKFSFPALLVGLGFGLLFACSKNSLVSDEHREIAPHIDIQYVGSADIPRVLCMVLTSPENHATRAQKIKLTWGRRYDALPSVALAVHEGKKFLWGKTREAFRYAWENYHDKVEWFFKVEDDTYAIVENLRDLLSKYSSSEAIWFGYNRAQSYRSNNTIGFHEGAGYVLSREATRRFAKIGYFNNLLCKHHEFGNQRIDMGLCMKNLNVTAMSSTDAQGKERFFPRVPEDHRTKHSSKPLVKDLGCCSDTAITFHYFEPDQLVLMDYLIYRLEPYNLSRNYEL